MSARDLATEAAAVWRWPAWDGSAPVGQPELVLDGLLAVPTCPLTPELAQTVQLEAAREARVTWLFAADGLTNPVVIEGDLLEMEGERFIVRSVAEWQRRGGSYVECVLEQEKVAP